VQVTWGVRRNSTMTKAELGHFEKAGVTPGKKLVELRLDDVSGYEIGQEILADTLEKGEMIDATAVSKGKGFAGGMKRHNFSVRVPPTVTTSTTALQDPSAPARPRSRL